VVLCPSVAGFYPRPSENRLARLREILRVAGKDRDLAIFADRSLRYREVREVLAAASAAEFSEVSLVTLQRPPA
jgi:biopolymer transport protein ExbD